MSDLNHRSVTELAGLIRAGEAKPSEVMQAHLDRIALREPIVGAFQHLDADRAMERARIADTLPIGGPLHGVPFAIKDIIDTDDMPTGWGSDLYRDRQPDRTAICVQAFLNAGAIPVGKTVTTEFAYFRPGKTANPHNPAHTPGGSSSGSAAAVADFMVPLAFGSQTAASLIRPAAYCGVCGFRPTINSYPLEGVMGLSHSLDTLGVLARDPADLALTDAVLRGVDPPSVPCFEDNLPRISLMRGPHWMDGSIEMRDACSRALSAIADAGAEAGEMAHPPVFTELTAAHNTVMSYEAACLRHQEFDLGVPAISPQFHALIEAGQQVSEGEYQQALAVRDRANAILDQLFEDTDALLVPSAPGPAPAGLEATGDPLFSRMWNLLQVPSFAIPFGKAPNGLPLGIQLIAPRGADARLLDTAQWVQDTLKHSN
ncbi:amidase [Ruegeria lacuscaerulensis]|uniref:amidase n=1 Tax=Ruegeria lacuscaerulensis TaxID=55218 RepID=UPI00147A4D07|nr:amidase [Ruegeria lacuscaerulensis]